MNFLGDRLVLNEMANLMKSSNAEYKTITFISTINATGGRWGFQVYSAAKAGLVNLSKTLAHELGKYNIRVNLLSLGTVISEKTLKEGKNFDLLCSTKVFIFKMWTQYAKNINFEVFH